MTSNKTEQFRILPYLDSHHKHKKETYAFIRVVNRNDRNKTTDIPIYLPDGIRLKVKYQAFEAGKILDGYYSEQETITINDRIEEIYIAVKKYVSKNPLFTRVLVEEAVYGKDFLDSHKKSRKREIHIGKYEREYSDFYKEQRKKFPKRKERITYSSVDDEGFEQKEIKEVVIDPLDIHADNFPENFPKELYKELANEYKVLFGKTQKDKSLLDRFVKFHASLLFYGESKTIDVVKVDHSILKEYEKEYGLTWHFDVDNETTFLSSETEKKILTFKEAKDLEKLAEKIKELSPLERYQNGHYNKENIFEVVGQILFLNKSKHKPYSKNWKMGVMKLFDYRSRVKPLENVKDLSVEWIDEFISYIKEHGYSKAHPKHFNPFDYDPEVFAKSETGLYNDLSLQKLIKNVKEVFRHLISENRLPVINIDKIKYEDYNLTNVKQDTEEHFYLTKPELDKLFHFNSFKDVLANKRLIYSKEMLAKARDLFILQFWFGGLRPREELLLDDGITILDDGYGGKKVHYFISKDSNTTNENPICTYSALILEKYNYDFESIKIDYTNYSKILKEIGKQVFNRKIIKYVQFNGKLEKQETNVNKEFTSYFARRTFEQILNFAGVNQADTAAFTGRKLNLGSIKNYRSLTYEQKRGIMEKIKP